MNEQKKERLLEFLKKKDWTSTSQIASTIRPMMSFYLINELLEELEKEGKIEVNRAVGGTYWRLHNKKHDGAGS